MKKQKGLTLFELLITLTIAAIIFGIGVPSFLDTIRTSRTVTEVNSLISAVNLARSTATSRGQQTLVEPIDGNDWSTGWLVGIDGDNDGNFPNNDDPIIRSFSAPTNLNFVEAPNTVRYEPTGEAVALSTFTIVPDSCNDTNNKTRTLTIALAGYADLTYQTCP